MKLDIGKTYIVYTVSEYITNKQVRILSYCSYEEASKYSSFIENVAINEKFINTTEDTATYLADQIYYKCAVVELSEGSYVATGETIILWDDIIDSDKTQRLYQDYTFKLTFKFKNIDDADSITKDGVIEALENYIASKYNSSKTKVDATFTEITDNSLDSVTSQLTSALEAISSAETTLSTLNSMQTSAKNIISSFEDNNIDTRITNIATELGTIESSIETIESRLQ